MPNDEITALGKIASALEGLDDEAVGRIVSWILSKHKLSGIEPKNSATGSGVKATTGTPLEFDNFVDFYDAANPKTENQKVLVAGYWLQNSEAKDEWDSQSLNDMLKNLGHPISNITRSLTRLQGAKPRLAMQTQKSGKAKQARKLYKLTVEGIKVVKKMLAGEVVDAGEAS